MNHFREEDYFRSYNKKKDPKSLDLDAIQKRISEIKQEIEQPHKCGKHCLCVAIKINLNILDAYLRRMK